MKKNIKVMLHKKAEKAACYELSKTRSALMKCFFLHHVMPHDFNTGLSFRPRLMMTSTVVFCIALKLTPFKKLVKRPSQRNCVLYAIMLGMSALLLKNVKHSELRFYMNTTYVVKTEKRFANAAVRQCVGNNK